MSSPPPTVLTEVVDDRIFVITINRPEVHNCVDGPTASRLSEAWKRFRDDDGLWVAILTGAGPAAFCSGADLKNAASLALPQGLSPQARRRYLYSGEGYMGYTRGTDLFKPILGAVNGYAFAGGLELACLCDFRIAAANAEFGVLCRRWNVPLLDGGTQRLPLIVGLGNALKLILTGERIGVEEALRIHLINEIVPEGQALERALGWARVLCGYPQGAMRSDKQAVLMGIGRLMDDRLRMEAVMGESVIFGRDMQEGMAAFAARRSGGFSEER